VKKKQPLKENRDSLSKEKISRVQLQLSHIELCFIKILKKASNDKTFLE